MRRCVLAFEPSRFVLRCSLAASLTYELAAFVGLQHPVWAPVEALVVSQETMTETLDSIRERLLGTLIGVAVALFVGVLGSAIGLPLILQIAMSVAACAAATSIRPTIRVCLWTCPLLLVAATSPGTPELVGLIRVSQVLLGAMVGGMMHVVDQKVWDDWSSRSAGKEMGLAKLRSSAQGARKCGNSRVRGHVQ
jgi:uncharacterized membrane protein YccC